MTILTILQYPDPRLRSIANRVDDIKNKRIQNIIDDMLETLAKTAHCAGLSATQLDIDLPPQITVINSPIDIGETLCLINPEILFSEGEEIQEEGCMSVYPAEVSALVERAEKIKVRAQDRFGNIIELAAEGFFARVIQHEVDHLKGKLFIDKISKLKRSRIDKKIAKLAHQKCVE